MKVLILDIETRPHVVYCWGFWKVNIGPNQVIDHGGIMSFAAKWLGEDQVHYFEDRSGNDKDLVEKICEFLDEADIVVAHNGEKFDLPKIRARALVYGITPPSPVKVVDTLKTARREFGFSSNSLSYLSDVLDLGTKKGEHKKFPGMSLWTECLAGNEEAWAEMKHYNILDVIALEDLYLKLRPWDTRHPNVAVKLEEKEKPVCPKCGGTHLQYRGYAYTQTSKYHRLQCNSCGGWSRTRYSLLPKNEHLVVSQVS